MQSGGTLDDLFRAIWWKYHDPSAWKQKQLLEKEYGDYGKLDIM